MNPAGSHLPASALRAGQIRAWSGCAHAWARTALAAALAIGLCAAGCNLLLFDDGDYDDDDDFDFYVVCTEDIVNDSAFREVVDLPPGARSRGFGFTAFAGATYTAEIRILDGSQSFTVGFSAGDGAGTFASGAIAAPTLTATFSPPRAGGATLVLSNQGTSPLLLELRGLTAVGAEQAHAIGLNVHFCGPLGTTTPAQATATALELADGLRPFLETCGIALAEVNTYAHTTAELRSIGAFLDFAGNAVLIVEPVDAAHSNCGTGVVAVFGLDELERLARADNDNIDLFLTGPIEGGIAGLSPTGGRFRGTSSAGMAVELVDARGLRNPSAQLVRTTIHEIGHFLGLPHTSDYDYGSNTFSSDGIADTPASSAFTDRDGDGFPGPGEGCPDESNVMFPRLSGGCIFSQDQAAAMRRWVGLVPHAAYPVAPTAPAAFGLDTIALAEAYADRPYATGIAVRGGTGPVTVSLTAGALPAGLTLTAEGRIFGQTPATGEFRITVRATDDAAATLERTYFLEVQPEALAAFYLPRLVSRPATGADLAVFPFRADGTPRTAYISATGGEGRYRFAFSGASTLPDPDTGVFAIMSGTLGAELGVVTVSDVNRSETATGALVGE